MALAGLGRQAGGVPEAGPGPGAGKAGRVRALTPFRPKCAVKTPGKLLVKEITSIQESSREFI